MTQLIKNFHIIKIKTNLEFDYKQFALSYNGNKIFILDTNNINILTNNGSTWNNDNIYIHKISYDSGPLKLITASYDGTNLIVITKK